MASKRKSIRRIDCIVLFSDKVSLNMEISKHVEANPDIIAPKREARQAVAIILYLRDNVFSFIMKIADKIEKMRRPKMINESIKPCSVRNVRKQFTIVR
jgi:hypothetical protein